MYESPLEWCPACQEWVALDQSLAERTRTNVCLPERCPLARHFAGDAGHAARPPRPAAEQR